MSYQARFKIYQRGDQADSLTANLDVKHNATIDDLKEALASGMGAQLGYPGSDFWKKEDFMTLALRGALMTQEVGSLWRIDDLIQVVVKQERFKEFDQYILAHETTSPIAPPALVAKVKARQSLEFAKQRLN